MATRLGVRGKIIMNIKIISVDFQNDFTSEGGISYRPNRPSVDFVKNILCPFLKHHGLKIAEIVSDYRPPRPGDRGNLCHPGQWGYESEIPSDCKEKNIWIKCMNSPVWTRQNIGEANKEPGLPYQDVKAFNTWLEEAVGKPDQVDMVVLIGLTADCCVLCTSQELNFRAYNVRTLVEATDMSRGNESDKIQMLNSRPANNWMKPISWHEFKKLFE
jgi:nicotinamidase-related amidase